MAAQGVGEAAGDEGEVLLAGLAVEVRGGGACAQGFCYPTRLVCCRRGGVPIRSEEEREVKGNAKNAKGTEEMGEMRGELDLWLEEIRKGNAVKRNCGVVVEGHMVEDKREDLLGVPRMCWETNGLQLGYRCSLVAIVPVSSCN